MGDIVLIKKRPGKSNYISGIIGFSRSLFNQCNIYKQRNIICMLWPYELLDREFMYCTAAAHPVLIYYYIGVDLFQ